jgi:hypothetical protein
MYLQPILGIMQAGAACSIYHCLLGEGNRGAIKRATYMLEESQGVERQP